MGIHVVPATSGSYASRVSGQKVSSYYFYTDYDPTKHFEYRVVFNENNTINQAETLDNQRDAFQEAVEYHLLFEQPIPAENTDYVNFYIPSYIQADPQDYVDMAQIDYAEVTENDLLSKVVKLPTKSQITGQVGIDKNLTKDFSDMTLAELEDVVSGSIEPYTDASKKNKHLYQCALYCRVERPIKLVKHNNEWMAKQVIDENGQGIFQNTYTYKSQSGADLIKNSKKPEIVYTNGFEFRKTLGLLNQTLHTKIPTEEGWYRYDKFEKKWIYLCKINPTLNLNYPFLWADGGVTR